ncbi:MAG TPA: hypothetical protein VFZ66_29655 [Herpetosiphonaceae bacterium]
MIRIRILAALALLSLAPAPTYAAHLAPPVSRPVARIGDCTEDEIPAIDAAPVVGGWQPGRVAQLGCWVKE